MNINISFLKQLSQTAEKIQHLTILIVQPDLCGRHAPFLQHASSKNSTGAQHRVAELAVLDNYRQFLICFKKII